MILNIALTSCEKEEQLYETCPYCGRSHYHNWDDCRNRDYYDQLNTETSIIDFGYDATATVTTLDNGYSFDYAVWVTTGKSGYTDTYEKSTVNLNAKAAHINSEIFVWDFNLSNVQKTREIRSLGAERKGSISVYDSLFVYSVRYDGFAVNFELPFQAAVYNNGKILKSLPYHSFTNVVDRGHAMTDLPNDNIGGNLYSCKLYRHNIEVTFGGRTYELHATLILKKLLGSADGATVIGSRLLGSGTRSIVNSAKETTYISWMKVEQNLADGRTVQEVYEIEMRGNLWITRIGAQTVRYTGVTKSSAGYNANDEHVLVVRRNNYISQSYYERKYVVQYNHFRININVNHSEAVYNDGINTFEFPCLRYGNINDGFTLVKTGSHSDSWGSYETYTFTQNVNGNFGSYNHRESDSFDVVVIQ